MDTFTWFDEWLAFVDGCLERYGWAQMHVLGDHHGPPWTYTIGLLERMAHPELVVIATGERTADALLRPLVERIKDGERLTPGEVVDIEGLAVKLGEVHPRYWDTGLFMKWLHYYESLGPPPERLEALQVIWPDEAGRFPDDPGADPQVVATQRLLSTTPVWP